MAALSQVTHLPGRPPSGAYLCVGQDVGYGQLHALWILGPGRNERQETESLPNAQNNPCQAAPLPQTEETSSSPSAGRGGGQGSTRGQVSHQHPPMTTSQSKKDPQPHCNEQPVPESLLTFFAVRKFSVLMVSCKVMLNLRPWMKLLLHASKQTRAGIRWAGRPMDRSVLATTMRGNEFTRRS